MLLVEKQSQFLRTQAGHVSNGLLSIPLLAITPAHVKAIASYPRANIQTDESFDSGGWRSDQYLIDSAETTDGPSPSHAGSDN